MKRTVALLLLLVSLLTAGTSLADGYSFPAKGVSFLGEVVLLVTPETVSQHAAELTALNVSADALLGDFIANHTIFAVLLEGGAYVSLSGVSTRETRGWQSAARMTEQERTALLSAFEMTPYEGAQWVDTSPPAVQSTYTLESGGVPTLFASLATVERGTLYRLTASGAGHSEEALHAAARDVLQMTEFLPVASGDLFFDQAPEAPEPVADDGIVTPLALVDFTGITLTDMTDIRVQTLPNADLSLRTANDTLRGRADASGLHTFSVSTKRETEYTYAILAAAEGRAESFLDLTLERRVSGESFESAYRRNAFPIERIGYDNIKSTSVGTTLLFRGKVGDFSSLYGYPCVLIYTQNPSLGNWEAPLWVQLIGPLPPLEMDAIYTVYGDLTEETIAHMNKKGEFVQVPVVASQMVNE